MILKYSVYTKNTALKVYTINYMISACCDYYFKAGKSNKHSITRQNNMHSICIFTVSYKDYRFLGRKDQRKEYWNME